MKKTSVAELGHSDLRPIYGSPVKLISQEILNRF